VTVRILLADDQELVRAGLEMIIDSTEDLVVVGQAEDGEQAVDLARRLEPDVILMDVRMPAMDGIDATRRIVGHRRSDTPRVLMLTTFDLDEYVFGAFKAGASGFLVKDAPREQIIEGITAVAAGEALASPSVTRRLIERFVDTPGPAPAPPPQLEELTPREREVLELMARGLSNTELAEHLYLSEKTVKTHVGRILMKLDLRDRVQAVILAYEAGIVAPVPDRGGLRTANVGATVNRRLAAIEPSLAELHRSEDRLRAVILASPRLTCRREQRHGRG
jgi:DNA-binding NarL/FixJ family response regulator